MNDFQKSSNSWDSEGKQPHNEAAGRRDSKKALSDFEAWLDGQLADLEERFYEFETTASKRQFFSR